MKKSTLLFVELILLTINIHAQKVTDYDGNVYDTVHIGTQVWLKENLAATKYNDGTPIPLVTDITTWCNLITPGYCWYNNDSATYKDPYGALYNWYTVNTGKLCPAGWHVPSNEEWHTLMLFLDPAAKDQYGIESTTAGDKLKEAGLTHWGKGNNGTNSSGFTALGAGFRNTYDKSYEGHTAVVYFWSSSWHITNTNVWERYISNNSSNVNEDIYFPPQGMSVRCMQDVTSGMGSIHIINNIFIYPNPANDKITISCPGGIHRIEIYNITGELVLHSQSKSDREDIDIHSLSKGIYEIRVTLASLIVQKKLIKE